MKKAGQLNIAKGLNSKTDNQQKTLLQCWNANSAPKSSITTKNLTNNQGTLNAKKNDSKKSQNQNREKTSLANLGLDDDDEIIVVDTKLISNNEKEKHKEDSFSLVNDSPETIDDEDGDDLKMIEALNSYKNTSHFNDQNYSTSKTKDAYSNLTNFPDEDAQVEALTLGLNEDEILSTQYFDTSGYDKVAGSVWIYPDNMPTRSYQYSIVEQCLFKNTMVVLPTGMGKTFIAAVVMFNFYRWYPKGKVIFMAPTKPLVAQQAEACYKTVGIPKSDMIQMTGSSHSHDKRKDIWTEKRIFFLTPQIISNDIMRGNVDVDLIKCIVIDEAHKALGEYAFCKVIENVYQSNKNFRIVALTATPGSDIKAVQNVINKLLISNIELRSDESIDIQQYNHSREVNKFVLPITDEILSIKNAFLDMMKTVLKRLEINKFITNKDPNSLSKMFILERREYFRKNIPQGLDVCKNLSRPKRISFVECDVGLLITLLHSLELLCQYGVKSFYMFLKSFIENLDGSKTGAQQAKLKTEINNHEQMLAFYTRFKEVFDDKIISVPRTLRHPKLLKLEELILEHFQKFGKNDTRVMIFSQYRESVYEITEMLSSHAEIKPMEFVGQSAGGSRKSVTQKEQLEVVKKFRDGGYNTLVSTCVGEEGLDIGEVDLIICYDSQKSPIRLIQRMGRTGRKREGRIIILLTEGKEENTYKTSLSQKKNIYKIIANGQKNFNFFKDNPLMMPKGFRPKCHKLAIQLPAEEEPKPKVKKGTKKKNNDENGENIPLETKKKKSTKFSKPNINVDFDLLSQLPEINLDYNDVPNGSTSVVLEMNSSNIKKPTKETKPKKKAASTKKNANVTTNPNEIQLKLFQDTNFLNMTRKTLTRTNTGTILISKPPNIKNLTKFLSKKESVSIESLSKINLSDCIQLWQNDEDDFLTIGAFDESTESEKNNTSLNETLLLKEKFENYYSKLIEGINLSDDDDDDDVENESQEESDDLKIEETEIKESSKTESKIKDYEIPETVLNDLFMEEDDDYDVVEPKLPKCDPIQINKLSKLSELFCDEDDDEDDEKLLNFVENFRESSKSVNVTMHVPDTMNFPDNNLYQKKPSLDSNSKRLLKDKTNGLQTIKEEIKAHESNLKKNKYSENYFSGIFSDVEEDFKENQENVGKKKPIKTNNTDQTKKKIFNESPLVIQKKYDNPLSELFDDDDDNFPNSCVTNIENQKENHHIVSLRNNIIVKSALTIESPTTQKAIIDSQLDNLLITVETQPKKLIPGSIKMTLKQPSISCKETTLTNQSNAHPNTIVKSNINFSLTDLNFDSDDDDEQENKSNKQTHVQISNDTKKCEIKYSNRLESIKFEYQINSPSSANQKSNSTSTPRSILKNKVNTEISYSPLVLSQTQNKNKINLETSKRDHGEKGNEMHHTNSSVVGMTQALDLLKSPNTSIKHVQLEENKNLIKSCFKMKSTLDDLFTEEDLVEKPINLSESKAKTRLRFDDSCLPKKSDVVVSPIKISSREESNANTTDESVFVIKKDETAKISSNPSEDSEFDEIIGGNNRRLRKVKKNQLETTDETENDESLNYERNFARKKRKTNKNSFLMDECNSDTENDDDDETSDDEENEYDLKDSLIDSKDYSHDS